MRVADPVAPLQVRDARDRQEIISLVGVGNAGFYDQLSRKDGWPAVGIWAAEFYPQTGHAGGCDVYAFKDGKTLIKNLMRKQKP